MVKCSFCNENKAEVRTNVLPDVGEYSRWICWSMSCHEKLNALLRDSMQDMLSGTDSGKVVLDVDKFTNSELFWDSVGKFNENKERVNEKQTS